ncbi:hypothetical protein IFM89_039976, partial [Coptis chinensis]
HLLQRNKPRGEETIEAETVVTLERREPSGLKLVSGSIMMDKAWVHWKRNTVEYRRAVETFVELAKKRTGETNLRCPCKVCQNFHRGNDDKVIEHLSSKQAKKRKLKEKRAIVAALRNSSNGGIRISDRNDGSPLTSQANDFHLSKKKSCVSEKSNSKKKNKSVKGATKRSKMSKMGSRDTNDVDPTDGDFSAEEDAHDFSEDDEIIPNSYSHGSRKNPTSNESHKSTKEGGSTKSKSFKKVEKRSRTKMDSSHDSSDEDYCSDEDGSKGTANRAKSKGPLIEEESEGDSSDEDAAIGSDEESESDEDDPSTKESHQSSKTPRGLCRSKVMATDSGSPVASSDPRWDYFRTLGGSLGKLRTHPFSSSGVKIINSLSDEKPLPLLVKPGLETFRLASA